jgi:hypothetical protein
MLVGIEPLHAGEAGLGLARLSLESVSQLATLYDRQHQHLHRHDQHAPWRPKVTRVTRVQESGYSVDDPPPPRSCKNKT